MEKRDVELWKKIRHRPAPLLVTSNLLVSSSQAISYQVALQQVRRVLRFPAFAVPIFPPPYHPFFTTVFWGLSPWQCALNPSPLADPIWSTCGVCCWMGKACRISAGVAILGLNICILLPMHPVILATLSPACPRSPMNDVEHVVQRSRDVDHDHELCYKSKASIWDRKL